MVSGHSSQGNSWPTNKSNCTKSYIIYNTGERKREEMKFSFDLFLFRTFSYAQSSYSEVTS